MSIECNAKDAKAESLRSKWTVTNGPCVTSLAVQVDDSAVTLDRAGTSEIVYRTTDGFAAARAATAVKVVDTKLPVFTRCPAEVVLHQGRDAYAFAAALVVDQCDGTMSTTTTHSGGVVDGETVPVAGTYDVTYSATDRAGNTATCDRTVKVVDDLAPICALRPYLAPTSADTPSIASGTDAVEACSGSFPDLAAARGANGGAGGGPGAACHLFSDGGGAFFISFVCSFLFCVLIYSFVCLYSFVCFPFSRRHRH